MSDNIKVQLEGYPDRMTSADVAKALNISLVALHKQISRGTIDIPFIKIGKAREFLRRDVERFLEERYNEAHQNASAAQVAKAS